MMLKIGPLYLKEILVLLLLGTALNTSAQKLKSGPVYEAEWHSYYPNIRGQDENNVYLANKDSQDIIVEAFDKNTLKRVYSKRYEDMVPFGKLKSLINLEKILFIDGSILVFVSGGYFDGSYSELYVHRIEAVTGKKLSTDTLIHKKIEDLPVFSTHEKLANRLGSYRIHSCKGNKRFVVNYATRNYELERYFDQIMVLNGEMEVLLNKEFVRKKASELVPANVDVDSEGSLYYLEDNNIVFLDFYQEYEEWREPLPSNIFESNAFPSRITATFNNEGNLIITAAYVTEDIKDTDENKPRPETREGDTQVEGIVYIEVDAFNKEIAKVQVNKFDKAFLDEFKTEDYIKYNEEAEFNNVFTWFQYRFTDSATILIGHEVPKIQGVPNFDYKSLVAFSFDREGRLNWAHHIPKWQVANEKNTIYGYMSFLGEEKLHIFFNDDEGNFEGDQRQVLDLRKLNHSKYAIPVLYSIDLKTGKMEYKVERAWGNDKDLKLDPYLSEYSEQGAPVFIFAKDRRDYRLSRIDP